MEYGFIGTYVHKDLGLVNVFVSELPNKEYYMMLEVWINGIEYNRYITYSSKPSHRLAGLKALDFLIELSENVCV